MSSLSPSPSPRDTVRRYALARLGALCGQCGSASLGQATVEFALVSVSLLLVLLGTLDFGRAILYNNMLGDAVRAGARRASVTSQAAFALDGNLPGTYTSTAAFADTTTIVGATVDRVSALDLAPLRVSVEAPMGIVSGFDLPVTVSADYAFRPVVGVPFGVTAITVTAQSTMQIR